MSNSSFYSNTGITSADVSSITSSKEAAATSETNAATSATNAATSATQAATSATNAATSETNAATSATNAATSASSVGTSETNASASAATATTQASNAATSATAAAGSASAANTSKTNAASSETNAATSATNAATSATSAATSATSAGTSATNAATSETNAAASSSSASGYVTSATTQANNAATSATAAATSETNAATSATAASTSASGASTSASNANTSATNAASSASQAASSAAAAALAADNFDDTYLGSNSSDPAADNDGDALNAGDLHFNTTSNTLKVYNGSAWQDAAVDSSGFVQTTGDTLTGALTFASGQTFDGRDVSADGTKLDTIETNADVTDATNVTAAGALMDSELTNIAAVKALNQGLATTDEPSFDNTTLNAIAATISDTAVDIFVYDTRKDSDGGAWRKRTQHTSWYNETLNTATRGSRKEFPAVAVIVAEADTVTIYDGDDPSLPLWKELNPYASTTTSVTASNGHIVVGNDSGSNNTASGGVWDFRFIEDISFHWAATGSSNLGYNSGISSSAQTVPVEVKYSGEGLVHNDVNDVAMTVLPNAPIDSATGLPRVTTAVATDGGVSVIKDDGTVVDTTSTDVFNGVSFTKSQYGADLYAVNTTFADDTQWFPNVGGLSDGFTFTKNFYARTPSYEKLSSDILSRQSGNVFALIAEHTFAVGMGTSGGINLDPALNLVQHSTTLDDSGLVAFINDDHNTGWQNGAIKGAFLSDTDDTDLVYTILNSTTDYTSEWGFAGSDWTINATSLVCSGVSGTQVVGFDFSNAGLPQNIGDSVAIKFTVSSYTSGSLAVSFSNGTADTATVSATGNYEFVGALSANDLIYFRSLSFAGTITNIEISVPDADRSVNNNGLTVNGTVTRTPVATGADLVAYSGFSSSNYLEQPYNSDLDFGTGDFSIITWAKTNGSVNNNQTLFNMGYNSGSTWEYWIALQILGSNGNIRFVTAESGSFTTEDAAVDADTGTWTCIAATRRSGVLEVYQNGTFLSSDSGAVRDLTIDANAKSRIGLQLDNSSTSAADDTSVALLRISATAPSPEQIAKIYEDEKFLFQENAQATLYGSSDAVTALAYDNTTELLHVGTSAGRSVFQGLRRVENTTDAVGAAISANNGLVAED